jgi:hypothetical protein
MDTLGFIASIIGSLAWPSVVLVCIFLLRKPLAQLIPLLRGLKYKGLEIDFGKRLEQLEEQADMASLPSIQPDAEMGQAPSPEVRYWETIELLSEVSPRSAIAEAWLRVEWALEDYFRRLGVERPQSYQGMLRVLRSRGQVPRAAFSLFEDLRVLRNRAVHARDFDLDSQRALEFARLAERLVAALEAKPAET